MKPHDAVASTLERHRVLPVVTVTDEADLSATTAALLGGGLPIIEVTLRTPFALTAVERSAGIEGMTVGAGSVNDVAQAEQAVEAGARFLVSPGLVPDVASWCRSQDVPLFPGAATPGEVLDVRSHGLAVAKFFPASVFGGPQWVRAVSAPIGDMAFVPTGGVDDSTFEDYLRTPGVLAVGGSWFLRAVDPAERAAKVADIVKRARAAAGERAER